MFKPSHISKIHQGFMKCVVFFWLKKFTCPSFCLENSDKNSLKTRDHQTTQSLGSFTIQVQRVCRTENAKARWQWEEFNFSVMSWQPIFNPPWKRQNGNTSAQCRGQ